MRTLERRVEALEAKHGTECEVTDVIMVSLVAPGEARPELQTLTCGDLAWHRQDGETEDQFKDRACAEAPRANASIPVLLTGDPV